MTIIVSYEHKDFFGDIHLIDAKKENATKEDLKKAFAHLKKNFFNVIKIDNKVIYWDMMQDFEYKTVTIKEYESWNSYKEYIQDYEACKKEFYKIFSV